MWPKENASPKRTQYPDRLRATTEKTGAEFLDHDGMMGHFEFRVFHFSGSEFNADSEDEKIGDHSERSSNKIR